MTDRRDLAFLEMAYGLAEKARGRTSPNPMVGSVVVRRGAVVGWGWHERAGLPHAEIAALRRSGRAAAGADLYVTLEPCVHWGRTPPCADAVLRAGLRRVVVSAVDPNPIVAGRGLRRLRGAGLDVTVGLLAERNERLNASYAKFITRRRPWVTLKAACSLDGRIAARSGDSRWISSPAARRFAHLLRGEHDAVLAGIGTVLRDDPRLTVRLRAWGRKPVLRAVLDSRLRIPETARLLAAPSEGGGGVLVLAGPHADPEKAARLRGRGVDVVPVKAASAGGLDLEDALRVLGEREVASVLVEGGSGVLSSFLDARLADRVVLAVAPLLIGGSGAPALFEGSGAERVAAAVRLVRPRSFRLGGDLIVEGGL